MPATLGGISFIGIKYAVGGILTWEAREVYSSRTAHCKVDSRMSDLSRGASSWARGLSSTNFSSCSRCAVGELFLDSTLLTNAPHIKHRAYTQAQLQD